MMIFQILFSWLLVKSVLSLSIEFKVSSIHDKIQKENVNCTEIIDYFLQRAFKYNSKLNAIINFNPKAVIEAQVLDDFFFTNKKLIGKLHCVPVLVKDNIAVKDIPTTGGIKALRYSIPNKDAFIVERLKSEGAIIIGKANLAEMAFSAYDSETGGACRNPWDLTRSCSRSSSGSACGVAAGLSIIAIGTDTDGSILGPSSYNGVFGLRPPYGQSNLDGVIPLLERDDTVGPLAKNLDDLVLAYSVITNNSSVYSNYIASPIVKSSFRIGYLTNFLNYFNVTIEGVITYIYELDKDVKEAFFKTINNFKSLNMEVVELKIPDDTFNKLISDLKDAYVERQFNCAFQCYKASLNVYFGNKERFQNDSIYRSFGDLKQSSLLSDFFQGFLGNTDVNDPENTCSNLCQTYDAFKANFSKIVESWYQLTNPKVDILLFPSSVIVPEKLDDASAETRLNAYFVATFSGYSALNIPAQYSISDKNAPNGLPLCVMSLASKEGFSKMLQIAKIYEDGYLKSKMLPQSVPVITLKCSNNGGEKRNVSIYTSFTLVLISSALFFFF